MIPIFINVRDRLKTTRALAEFCAALPGAEVHLVDNASTYGPLLDWYSTCGLTVHRCENGGPRTPWRFANELRDGHYVVTDCDLDLTGVPCDVLDVLAEALEFCDDICKAGLALRIDDLPADHLARTMEAGHWTKRHTAIHRELYYAPIDTTFAMYRAGEPFGYTPALRLAGQYTARHAPWYYDAANLPDDEQHYLANMQHANALFYSPRMKAEATR